jgi:hypothetical protein
MIKHPTPLLLLLASLILAATAIPHAAAQWDDSPYGEPLNLSNSGGTSSPRLLVASDGQAHLIWEDEFLGTIYTQSAGADQWSTAIPVSLPFRADATGLKVLADPRGLVHAFWLEDDSLRYSQAAAASFGEGLAWSAPQTLALACPAFDAALSAEGRLYVAFVRAESAADFPAGVYAWYSDNPLAGWSGPAQLFASTYFRGLTPEKAHVQIAAGEQGLVYALWDDRAQERVWLARSDSSGLVWGAPFEIDRRQAGDGNESLGPSQGMALAYGDNLLILWQAGHQGAACSQYFQWSGDGGLTFDERQVYAAPGQGCPAMLRFLVSNSGPLWLLAGSPGGLYLSTWDASANAWSPPQLQNGLNNFTHPETFRQVTLEAFDLALRGDALLVAGSDPQGGDIWFTSRLLGAPEAWLPTPTPLPAWSTPAAIAQNGEPVAAPILVRSADGRLHALWSQASSGALYYALFDGARWSQPLAVLNSPGGRPGALSAAIDRGGFLFAAWDDGDSSELYASWTNAGLALLSGEWASPEELPLPPGTRWPSLQVDGEGVLHLAYALPLNEGRGVYLLSATAPIQAGQPLRWNQPQQVFDAGQAGWDMVAEPQLALAADGTRLLLWQRYTLPPDVQPVGLYFSRSMGEAFPPPAEVTRGALRWSQLLAGSDGALHRAWQIESGGRALVYHQYSTDNGQSWSEAAQVGGMGSASGPVSLLLDGAGRLHLVQIGVGGFAGLTLQSWLWAGPGASTGADAGWLAGERLALADLTEPGSLAAISPGDGGLATVYLAQSLDEDEQVIYGLYFNQRPLQLPDTLPTPLPTFTPQPTAVESANTLEATPTPALVFSTAPQGGRVAGLLSNRWVGMLVGALPAALVVGAGLAWGIRRLKRRQL